MNTGALGRSRRLKLLCIAFGVALALIAPTLGANSGSLQAKLDAAKPGDVIRLDAGTYKGPLIIQTSLTLKGEGATIDGEGAPKVIVIDAPNVTLEGLQIQKSGVDVGGPDTCVYLTEKARGSALKGNHFKECAFGVWVHETSNVTIEDNVVEGTLKGYRSERGNGIHLFNASKMVVRNNTIRGGRDAIYVSATEDSLIEGNHMSETRYGVHYMFSYSNQVINNVAHKNTTGYALMESHHIRVENNRATQNEERGILFRDVQYCKITGNVISGNGEGLFFFSSTENTVSNNTISGNKVGARIWAGTLRNLVTKNAFRGNALQIFYVGTSDVFLPDEGPGNFWSDYLGWDQNGDGVGDRPYRVDSFSSRLTHRFPAAALLLRSPALELLSHLQEDLPLLRVPTAIDKSPLMTEP